MSAIQIIPTVLSPQSSTAWIAVVSVFQITALLLTTFRVYHRFTTSRMWWDDYVVTLVFVLDALGFVNIWYGYSHHFEKFLEGRLLFNFFITYLFQFSTVWLTRVSLALSIARIFPKGHRARRIAMALAVLFIINLIATLVVLNVTCQGGGVSWWNITGEYCARGPKGIFVGGATSASLQLLSDVVLVVTPLIILWRVKLPTRSRYVILVAFSGSILMVIFIIVFYVVCFGPGFQPKLTTIYITPMISQLEMATSVIVCNFLVMTTLAYKAYRRREGVQPQRRRFSTTESESDSSDFDESSSRTDDTELSSPRGTVPESTQPRTAITFTDVMTDSELYHETTPGAVKTELDGSKSE